MSATRIVRRKLKGAGEVTHYGGTWLDRRPRDKFGILSGYCSEMEKKRREKAPMPDDPKHSGYDLKTTLWVLGLVLGVIDFWSAVILLAMWMNRVYGG